MSVRAYKAPATFRMKAFGERWYSWSEVAACFWPRAAGFASSKQADPLLAPIAHEGGVYLLAWSKAKLPAPSPDLQAVQYVGETNWFKKRMGQFGASAGFFGERTRGHSAGWRWRRGTKHLRVAFFAVSWPEGEAHLAVGLRKWLEALAIERFRERHGRLPSINELMPPGA